MPLPPQDRAALRELDRKLRKRKKEQRTAILILLGIVLLIFGLGALFGWHLGKAHTEPAPTRLATTLEHTNSGTLTVTPTVFTTEPTEKQTPIVIESEGNILSLELQSVMAKMCDKYGVPYALALAVADHESRFDPDAKSSTNDFGLMQINSINFEWLKEKGIDPLTYEGNIEAGVLMLSKSLDCYGEIELALMAYNCGDTGAKRLWDAGTYSTEYSRSVMERYQKWVRVLEGK